MWIIRWRLSRLTMGTSFRKLWTFVRPRQWQWRRKEAFRVCLGSGSNRICLRMEWDCEGKRSRMLPGFGEGGGGIYWGKGDGHVWEEEERNLLACFRHITFEEPSPGSTLPWIENIERSNLLSAKMKTLWVLGGWLISLLSLGTRCAR